MSSTTPMNYEMPVRPRGPDAMTRAQRAADRYLKTVGVTIPYVRKQLVRAAADRIDIQDQSRDQRVLAVRMLASVERVLCDRLGAKPGSDTTDPDTARRRFLFSINPSPDSQMRLLLGAPDLSSKDDVEGVLIRIPPVEKRVPMPTQDVSFRLPPGMSYEPRGT
ncbi:MAG: hypothetical protein RLW87_10570 [Alphaproteobacteria bacterium]|uniref:hypothetical protein n=1 Tax=Pacificispira sp. TaxID=2888761 RepID=UPI0032F0EE67